MAVLASAVNIEISRVVRNHVIISPAIRWAWMINGQRCGNFAKTVGSILPKHLRYTDCSCA